MTGQIQLTDDWLRRIREQTENIKYGTVQITIHNGQIVQIDRTERSRYDVAKPSGHFKKT